MHMALVPTYSTMSTKNQDGSFHGYRRRRDVLLHTTFLNKSNTFSSLPTVYYCKMHKTSTLKNELQTHKSMTSVESQLEALHSYFNKLRNQSHRQQTSFMHSSDSKKNEIMEPSLQFPSQMTDFIVQKELNSLDNYLGKLKAVKSGKVSTPKEEYTQKEPTKRMKSYVQSRIKDDKAYFENSQSLQPQEDTSDLYLTCVLASINIAVFLFEIASPVKNSDLPLLYGAKINQLILDGEWWRLVTPMFLHSGILHVALRFWVLLTFGPQVSKGYGPCTFFLIYILGGISGNMTSYIHTPESTVGGTGPVFAIIGAWIIYQIQNKDVIQIEVMESMFRKAVIATALSFVLSNFGPIDDWTHLGAVCVGVAYGFLTCPTLQVDDSSSKPDQKNGSALIKQDRDSLKSVAMFVMFIAIMSTLLLFLEPQVYTLEDSFM